MVTKSKKVKEVFTIVVDYSRSLEDSIKAGRYSWINSYITEEHFPLTKEEYGKKERIFKLYHFNRVMWSDDAIRQMDEHGCRPTTLRELLAFGETNPELQRQFLIIALGSFWVFNSGYRSVPCLASSSSGLRNLRLGWYDGSRDAHCRFLAVGK